MCVCGDGGRKDEVMMMRKKMGVCGEGREDEVMMMGKKKDGCLRGRGEGVTEGDDDEKKRCVSVEMGRKDV
ncbi:hypothetical protein RRG08_062234, partial [Elysia crispata]